MRFAMNAYFVIALSLIFIAFGTLLLDDAGRSILATWGFGWNIFSNKSQEYPLVLILLAAGTWVIAGLFCWACYQQSRLSRLLCDIVRDEQTIPIRELKTASLVKIRGELNAEQEPLLSPLQQKPCVYYSTEVTKIRNYQGEGGSQNKILFSDKKQTAGFLDDGSARIAIATSFYDDNTSDAYHSLDRPDRKLIKRLKEISGYDFNSTEFIDSTLELHESSLDTGYCYLAVGQVCETSDGLFILRTSQRYNWRTPELAFLTQKTDRQAQEWLESESRRNNILSKTLMITLISALVGPLPLVVSLFIFGVCFFAISSSAPNPSVLKTKL